MFRPAKIHHATVIVKEDKVNSLINRLYELGICELKESDIDLSSKYSYEVVKNLDEIQGRFNLIMDSLEEYKEVEQPGNQLKKLISPEPPKKHKSMLYPTNEITEEVQYHLNLIEPKVLQRLEELQKINDDIEKNEFIISNLSSLPSVRTDFFRSTENIKILVGLVSTTSLAKVKEELANKLTDAIEHKKIKLNI